MSLSWKQIGKWIPIKSRYCASGYIRKIENQNHQIIIPHIFIQLITLDAFFFEIFVPIRTSFFESWQNQQQQNEYLIQLKRILQIKSKWDQETISVFNGKFANYLFETIRYPSKEMNNLQPSDIDTILWILTIIQRHTPQGPLFFKYRPDRVYFDLLIKYQENSNRISRKSESHLFYLLSKIIPENRIIRMYLYRKGLYEFLLQKTDHVITINIISSDILKYIQNLTLLLFTLFKYQQSNLYQEFEPWWMPKFKVLLSIIKSTLKFINTAQHQTNLNICNSDDIQSCLVNITTLILLISTTNQSFCIEEFIDYFEGESFLIFMNLVKSNYKEVRLNVIYFINNIFKINQEEAQDAVLKTGIIDELLPTCRYEQRVIINIWSNIFELGGSVANALLNDENKLSIIMKQLQYHAETEIRGAFKCTFGIFEDESLQSSKLIYFENGVLIDILCEKFNKIDTNNKESIYKCLIKEFNIWPMIFDCFEEIILQMKDADHHLASFIIGKLTQNNIMQIFQDLCLYDNKTNCFILNWWDWKQYTETFNFMKTMITDQTNK